MASSLYRLKVIISMAWKIKSGEETPHLFTPGGSGAGGFMVPFDIEALPAGGYWLSGVCDLGTSPRTTKFWWQAKTALTGAEIAGEFVSFYAATMDDNDLTNIDGLPPASGSLPNAGNYLLQTSPSAKNFEYVGSVVTDGTAGPLVTSGYVEIESRYLYLVAYNGTSKELSLPASDHQFTLVPMPDEVQ